MLDQGFIDTAIASAAVGAGGAVLSVFVVLRRWAFLGEGISHAGFGGVGTALLLSILLPALNNPAWIFLITAIFMLGTAVGVGWISRGNRSTSGDSAIGIFVAATLAWGLVAGSIHQKLGRGAAVGWDIYLFGDLAQISGAAAWLAVSVSLVVICTVAALGRQIVLYCFDPELAEVTGVPTGFIHYLLILMVALLTLVGVRLSGFLLMPAMLVLPGATGLAMSRKLRTVMCASVASSLAATAIGLAVTRHWTFFQPGPVIVMAMFLEFISAHLWGRIYRKS